MTLKICLNLSKQSVYLSFLAHCNSDHTLWPCGLSCTSGGICSWSSFDKQSVTQQHGSKQVKHKKQAGKKHYFMSKILFFFLHSSSLCDLLVHSCGSGVCGALGWNLQCSSCTSWLVRREQVWELFLPGTARDVLWPGKHTHIQWLMTLGNLMSRSRTITLILEGADKDDWNKHVWLRREKKMLKQDAGFTHLSWATAGSHRASCVFGHGAVQGVKPVLSFKERTTNSVNKLTLIALIEMSSTSNTKKQLWVYNVWWCINRCNIYVIFLL